MNKAKPANYAQHSELSSPGADQLHYVLVVTARFVPLIRISRDPELARTATSPAFLIGISGKQEDLSKSAALSYLHDSTPRNNQEIVSGISVRLALSGIWCNALRLLHPT